LMFRRPIKRRIFKNNKGRDEAKRSRKGRKDFSRAIRRISGDHCNQIQRIRLDPSCFCGLAGLAIEFVGFANISLRFVGSATSSTFCRQWSLHRACYRHTLRTTYLCEGIMPGLVLPSNLGLIHTSATLSSCFDKTHPKRAIH